MYTAFAVQCLVGLSTPHEPLFYTFACCAIFFIFCAPSKVLEHFYNGMNQPLSATRISAFIFQSKLFFIACFSAKITKINTRKSHHMTSRFARQQPRIFRWFYLPQKCIFNFYLSPKSTFAGSTRVSKFAIFAPAKSRSSIRCFSPALGTRHEMSQSILSLIAQRCQVA